MRKQSLSRQRPHERGQTMIFVAISIVSLLALAALAIDIVTLYVARTEIQRAADAAALAGAKAIVDSGLTTLPTSDGNYTNAKNLAQSMATASINAIISPPINQVAGGPPALVSIPSFDFTTHPGSYQVTVSLRRANLPTFFSKIWARSAATVTATATAEAYNPANLTAITPIALKSVKPWLVANADPTFTALTFVDTTTWIVDSGVIGKTFDLVSGCSGSTTPCLPTPNPIRFPVGATTPQVEYVPAQVTPTNSSNVCPNSGPSCNSSCLGGSDYELSIECADVNAYSYLNCGGGSTNATWDNSVNPGGASGPSAAGAECLIHATGPGSGPELDTLDSTLWPGAPMKITGGTCSAAPGQLVTASSSIVTIPIIADTSLSTGSPVTVVGFLQAFINQVDPVPGSLGLPPAGSINITVLNIVGCSSANNSVNPVVGVSGTSPVPVRLITPP